MKTLLGIGLFLLGTAIIPVALAEPLPGGFTWVADMRVARLAHAATLLADGRVLVTGGYVGVFQQQRQIAGSELYDPATRRFLPAAPMVYPRAWHTATLLDDGRVLIAGGGVYPAEIYDPATDTFREAAAMHSSGYVHAAARLADGRVLVVANNHAEIYDPREGTFRVAAPYVVEELQFLNSATSLQDGRVLLVGEGRAQIYDPARDAFSFIPSEDCDTAACGVELHAATLLDDGSVLVTGGLGYGIMDEAELYDPAAGKFTRTARMLSHRETHAAVRLPDGRVLIVGGSGPVCVGPGYGACSWNEWHASAELYDPVKGKFSPAGDMAVARAVPRATLLADGDVLITGGGFSPAAEVYRPVSTAPPNAPAILAEFFNPERDLYFLSLGPEERSYFSNGRAGQAWMGTGQVYGASLAARPGWNPVCRFFWNPRLDAGGRVTQPFSFFITIDPVECELVKNDSGWTYMGTAFYAVAPKEGACPPPLRVLWRAYNNGFPERDPNHRYSTDRAALDAMAERGWRVEGAAMCVQ